jgi:hypothetical protein
MIILRAKSRKQSKSDFYSWLSSPDGMADFDKLAVLSDYAVYHGQNQAPHRDIRALLEWSCLDGLELDPANDFPYDDAA